MSLIRSDTPFLTSFEEIGAGIVNRFEAKDFIIAHSFKTTGDPMENGLNSASTGSPLEINLEWNDTPNIAATGGAKEIQTFIQQSNTLYIKAGGQSSIIKG